MSSDEQDGIVKTVMQLKPQLLPFLVGMLGNAEDAEDVFQDSVIVVMHKWERFEQGTNLRAWAFEIARRTALKHIGKRKRHALGISPEALEVMQTELTGAPMLNNSPERRRALQECRDQLHPSSQDLLALRYGKGLSCEDVARRLKRPLNSIYVSLSKIRKLLKICIKRRAANYA